MNTAQTSLALPVAEIYTDGGCEPNPGTGGYGVVLLHPKKRAEASGAFRLTTNNCHRCFNHPNLY
jgi:ribonuclease HI